jgi:hypothetical protein
MAGKNTLLKGTDDKPRLFCQLGHYRYILLKSGLEHWMSLKCCEATGMRVLTDKREGTAAKVLQPSEIAFGKLKESPFSLTQWIAITCLHWNELDFSRLL